MNFLKKSTTLSIIAVSVLLASCQYVQQPVNAPKGNYSQTTPLQELDDYISVSILPVETNSTEQVDDFYTQNLFIITRQSFINSNIFQTVNGLKSSTYNPNQQSTTANTKIKTLTVQPKITSLNLTDINPSLQVQYTFIDTASNQPIGTLQVTGEGGEAGTSSAFQGIGLGLKKALYDHVKEL